MWRTRWGKDSKGSIFRNESPLRKISKIKKPRDSKSLFTRFFAMEGIFSKIKSPEGFYLPDPSSYKRLSSFLEAAWSSSNLHLFSASRCDLTKAANFVSSSCETSLRDEFGVIFSRGFLSPTSLKLSFPDFDDCILSNNHQMLDNRDRERGKKRDEKKWRVWSGRPIKLYPSSSIVMRFI